MNKIMKLYAALRKIREYERGQLPFLKSMVDFDIVIEIGFAEEEAHPLTLKQLFLLNISSRTTVRRRLAKLIDEGVVLRRKHKSDARTTVLTISGASQKILSKYGTALGSISGAIA